MNIKKIVVLAAVLCSPSLANAVPMTWNFSGTGSCTTGCAGAVTVTGSLTGNAAGGNPLILGASEVSAFTFSLTGGITDTISSGGPSGSYNLDSLGNIIGGSMSFGSLFFWGEQLSNGSSSWSYQDARAFAIDYRANGPGSYTNSAARVPEPGSLALLGTGLLALGLVRTRRRKDQV